MKRVVLLAGFILASCTSTATPVATLTPTPHSSPNPTAVGIPSPESSPSPSPSSSPSFSVIPSALGQSLSCRLPVIWNRTSPQPPVQGFVSFPSGELLVDASASASSVFYDRAFGKWLPVGRNSVSPDGKRYSYGEGSYYQNTGGKLHVVDVATGVDTVIYSGSAIYGVVDFAAEGIYLTNAAPEGRPRGLWLQDPAGGPARLISSTIAAPAIGGGAAWGVDFNTADPSPGPGGLEGPMNRVLRIDVHTGASTPWLYLPGSDVYITGFDFAGHPFVNAGFAATANSQYRTEVWLVQSATAATKISTASGLAPLPARVAAVDTHGVWLDDAFAPTSSVWLYTGGSLQSVATGNKTGVNSFAVAGGCIP